MIRRLCLPLVPWFLLIARASAASPLNCTRTILDRARTMAGGNQTHDEKLAALSVNALSVYVLELSTSAVPTYRHEAQ
jgi:hypothetical protein